MGDGPYRPIWTPSSQDDDFAVQVHAERRAAVVSIARISEVTIARRAIDRQHLHSAGCPAPSDEDIRITVVAKRAARRASERVVA